MYIHFNVHSLSVDSLYKRMWHDKKPQSKNFLWLHTSYIKLFHLQQNNDILHSIWWDNSSQAL